MASRNPATEIREKSSMTTNPADKVEQWPINKLVPYARNARTHSDEQVGQIAASIREWGWTTPILVDEEGSIIAGHGRTLAAQRLKMTEVPVMVAAGWSDAKKRAYVLADNKLALNAGWDNEMLALELGEIGDLGFDLDLTGFTAEEIAALMPVEIEPGLTDEDAVPEVPEQPVTVLGDVWVLGKHRVMCGDSTSIDAVIKLMDGQKADMVFTDPPYGMRLDTDYSKMGSTKTKYRQVIGDHEDFNAQDIFGVIQSPIYYLWGADYYSDTIPIYKDGSYFVWSKAQSESENSVFGSRFELCWRFPKRKKEVWFVRGINQSSERLGEHPTQKPTELTIRAVELETKPKAIVVDLFGGSGSTLIGCEKTNRYANLMELDPKYCDVIVKRWQDFTGKIATHAETGLPFAEVTNGH
jgi:DNA modification methylase